MRRFVRLTGIYLGLVEPTPEERAWEPVPLWRQALAIVITLTILLGLAFLFGHTVWGAVRFVLVGAAGLAAVRFLNRYQDRAGSGECRAQQRRAVGAADLDGAGVGAQRGAGHVADHIGTTGLDDVRLVRNKTESAPGNGAGLHLTGADGDRRGRPCAAQPRGG